MYGLGNPVKFTDPSGHDPLDSSWEAEWKQNHCGGQGACDIPDSERQYRLYSIAFSGPVSGSNSWSDADWIAFRSGRHNYYRNQGGGLDTFTGAVERLAAWYSPDEESQFVSGLGLLFTGWPYDPSGSGNIRSQALGFTSISMPGGGAYFPDFGQGGFSPYLLHTGDENVHHFAGHLMLSFYWGSSINNGATYFRETLQNAPAGAWETLSADISMGLMGGYMAEWLRLSSNSISGFAPTMHNTLSTGIPPAPFPIMPQSYYLIR